MAGKDDDKDMRPAKDTDFFIDLPDVGVFRFGRRTYGDRLRIRAEYLRLVQEHGDKDEQLTVYAGIVSSHKIMCVEAPKGWEDLSEIVLSRPGFDIDDKVYELYGKMKAQEDSFRSGQPQNGQVPG